MNKLAHFLPFFFGSINRKVVLTKLSENVVCSIKRKFVPTFKMVTLLKSCVLTTLGTTMRMTSAGTKKCQPVIITRVNFEPL